MKVPPSDLRTLNSQLWCVIIVVMVAVVAEVASLNGPNVCMVKQKYNITKRVKYRAPMSVRTYEWCFSMPPRCSRWNTEMRDLTRLETDERTAEVAVCCPGYKMKDVSCVPICPDGKMGPGCTEDCPDNKWGPNCANDCPTCSENGECSPLTGECECKDGWQGESCEIRMTTTTSPTTMAEKLLTTTKSTTFTNPTTTNPVSSTAVSNASTVNSTTPAITTITTLLTASSSTADSNASSVNSTTPAITTVTTLLTAVSNASTVNSTTPAITTITTLLTASSSTAVSNASSVNSTTPAITTVTTLLTSRGSSSSVSTTVTSPITTTSSTETLTMREQKSTTEIVLITTVNIEDKNNSTNKKGQIEHMKSTVLYKISAPRPDNVYNKVTNITEITPTSTESINQEITVSQAYTKSIYNRTEISIENTTTVPSTKSTFQTKTFTMASNITEINKYENIIRNQSILSTNLTNTNFTTTPTMTTSTEKIITNKTEATRRPETSMKAPTTQKTKPKEIWIKPTQKGESAIIDFKIKSVPDSTYLKHRGATKKEVTSEFTTPRTIIVSIIPTSVSYATFRKIALTTSSYLSMKNATSKQNKTEHGVTSSMSTLTSLPPFFKKIITTSASRNISFPSTYAPTISKNVSKHEPVLNKKKIISLTRTTNSMASMEANTSRTNSSNTLTVPSQTNSLPILTVKSSNVTNTKKPTSISFKRNSIEGTTKAVFSSHKRNLTNHITTKSMPTLKTTEAPKKTTIATKKEISNVPKITTVAPQVDFITTEGPVEDETFHILTEPEHITAVMSDRERDRTSMDLVSVVSIAGGVMMAVITVAVLIVMVERCRRPRYEEVRKDIRMQVMIDNNELPPPYMRSIFHTPLPEPPAAEKCHYQPISTLDRNLKQFMRPVVVQNISPIMLEDFRGILECHYDHLPRRNHDFGTMPTRFAAASSMSYSQELRCQKSRSVNDSAIEALKCEAKMDVIDSSTSEPLYAEIPCWRPPSEHAIEVVNLNGEAITEL